MDVGPERRDGWQENILKQAKKSDTAIEVGRNLRLVMRCQSQWWLLRCTTASMKRESGGREGSREEGVYHEVYCRKCCNRVAAKTNASAKTITAKQVSRRRASEEAHTNTAIAQTTDSVIKLFQD